MRKIKSSYNANYVFDVDATNVATNVVSVASDDVANVIADMGDQVTVVVVPAGSTEITDANIYYINQDANGNATVMLTNMGTKALAADTDYEVWVGGSNGTIKKGAFTTKVATPPVEIIYGDVNDDTFVTVGDASLVAQVAAGVLSFDDEAKDTAADVNADTFITVGDASLVAQKAAGVLTAFPVEE